VAVDPRVGGRFGNFHGIVRFFGFEWSSIPLGSAFVPTNAHWVNVVIHTTLPNCAAHGRWYEISHARIIIRSQLESGAPAQNQNRLVQPCQGQSGSRGEPKHDQSETLQRQRDDGDPVSAPSVDRVREEQSGGNEADAEKLSESPALCRSRAAWPCVRPATTIGTDCCATLWEPTKLLDLFQQ
jgi:hypothetical protein